MRQLAFLATVLLLAVAAAGCGSDDDSDAAGTTEATATAPAPDACEKENLDLVSPGKLTVGTDNPAYPPWFEGGTPKGSQWEINDPSTGKGFESAVAYAVAEQLGFTRDEVEWVVVPFSQSFKPGPKSFDFDINQISFTPQRARSVDFSDSYYDVNQALVAFKGTEIANAKSLADLKDRKLGVQIGTTSFDFVSNTLQPTKDPSVYDTSNDVISALKAKQIDGIVVDLPTAFFIAAAQLENGTVVGQFEPAGEQERFGMVFQKGSTLDECVNRALATLRENGTLAELQQTWLAENTDAPVLR